MGRFVPAAGVPRGRKAEASDVPKENYSAGDLLTLEHNADDEKAATEPLYVLVPDGAHEGETFIPTTEEVARCTSGPER